MFPFRGKRAPSWLAFLCLSLIIIVVSPHRHLRAHGDGYYHYLYLVTLFEDGDFDHANQYQKYGHPYDDPNNRFTYNPFPPGSALVWLPTYAVAHAWFTLKGAAPVDPFDPGFQSMALSGTWIAALLMLWLAWRWLRRSYEKAWVLPAFAGAALATPVYYYLVHSPSYAHIPSAFFLTLFLYLFFLHPEKTFWQGLVAGLATLTKHQSGLLLPLFLLYHAWNRKDPKGAGRFLGGFVLPLLPLLFYWHHEFGKWLTVPQGSGYMTANLSGVAHSVFSVRHGALVWSPLLLVALAGLVLLAFRKDAPMRFVLVFFAGMVAVNGLPRDWWAGHAFGNRRWVDLFPILAWGMAEGWSRLAGWVQAKPRKAALAAAWGLTGAAVLLSFGMMWAQIKGRISPVAYRDATGVYFPALDQIYQWIGNPLSWPDSLVFALRYSVHPRTYDDIVGSVLNYDASSNGPVLDPSRTDSRKYFYKGFVFNPYPRIIDSEARIFVPLEHKEFTNMMLLMDSPGGAVPLNILWNGKTVQRIERYSWREPFLVRILHDQVRIGTNVLELKFDRERPDVDFGLIWVQRSVPYFVGLLPFGWIDSVSYDPARNEITIQGWVLGRRNNVDVGLLKYPGPTVIPAQRRAPREDVRRTYPEASGHDRSGFVLTFAPDAPPGEKFLALLRMDEERGMSDLLVKDCPVRRDNP
jgi:hypothetical protein